MSPRPAVPSPALNGPARLRRLIASQRRAQRDRLGLAAACAVVATAAAVVLLGLSGWFITGAALAGLAGATVAHSFNVLLPSTAIRLLAILRTGLRYVERVSGHEAALKALAALRPVLFEDLASGRPDHALAVSSGEASARLIQDVDAIQTLFVRLSGAWGAAAGSLAAIGLALLAGPGAALVIASGLAVSVIGALVIGRRRIDRAGRQVQIATGLYKDRLSSLQASAAELRAYGLETWAVGAAAEAAEDLDAATLEVSTGSGWITAWQTLVMGASAIGVLAVAQDQAAPLVALATLAAVASMEAAAALTTHFRSTGAAREALARLAEFVPDRPAPAPIAVRNGSTREGHALGFVAVDLSLAPPARLAVTGPTGCGKTTLIERLMGLRHFAGSGLTVGGLPVEGLAVENFAVSESDRRALRSRFSYAAQEVRLLEGSLRSNLKIADPAADDARLWRALEDADLADRIRQSPSGLDLALSDNGAGLSGGERRRLGLARAYLRAAPWLVLDEPTEGLDAACEARVLSGLRRHLAASGQGLILISHRPAPRDLCDEVIAVEGIDRAGRLSLSRPHPKACAA